METSMEELKQLVKELLLSQRETDKKFRETDQMLSEMFRETDRKFSETDQKFSETDKKFRETDQLLSEKFRETDKQINAAMRLFTTQWGRLMESLVKGDLVNLLNGWGVPVNDVSSNRSGNHEGANYEFDIIAKNGGEIVIVEVKTTLRPDDVKKFAKKLQNAKIWLDEYADKTIYGAVAYLQTVGNADRLAAKKGMFVIRATGNSAAIVNEKGFQPKAY